MQQNENQKIEREPRPRRPRQTQQQKLTRIKKAALVDDALIREVFDFWVETFSKKRPILDDNRRVFIGAAIHDYGLEECKNAILGCSMSDFHMGRNETGTVYNELTLIFRDAEKTEKFLEYYDRYKPEEDGEPF